MLKVGLLIKGAALPDLHGAHSAQRRHQQTDAVARNNFPSLLISRERALANRIFYCCGDYFTLGIWTTRRTSRWMVACASPSFTLS